MGQKKIKQERFLMKQLEKLTPIREQAFIELEGDTDLLAKWASIALGVHITDPLIPLEHLLPNQLDKTLDRIKGQYNI